LHFVCSQLPPPSPAPIGLLKFFGATRAGDETPADVWPLGLAPFIRLGEGAALPHFG
jgi:hypothetical protein